LINAMQDVLRLLTLWYRYGFFEDVQAELNAGIKMVSVDTWLVAIPQMMARIHVDDRFIMEPLKDLLVKIGRNHPQALMHPLLVCTPILQCVLCIVRPPAVRQGWAKADVFVLQPR
jgi:serine/threonine-protein kinase mTOR